MKLTKTAVSQHEKTHAIPGMTGAVWKQSNDCESCHLLLTVRRDGIYYSTGGLWLKAHAYWVKLFDWTPCVVAVTELAAAPPALENPTGCVPFQAVTRRQCFSPGANCRRIESLRGR